MESKQRYSFIEETLGQIPDWRLDRRKRHNLVDILFISICAMISGADSFTEIEEFGRERSDWLSQYIDLSHGIPSHDTFRRIFMEMDPVSFGEVFREWMQGIAQISEGEIIALDGKQLRGMKDLGSDAMGFIW